jgi:CRP/FNR family transcriptional regulator
MHQSSANCVALQEPPAALSEQVPGVKTLQENTWGDVIAASRMLRCAPGTELDLCTSTAGKFIVVIEGVVRVYQTGGCGRELSLYRAYAGQPCMLSVTRLLGRANRYARAVTEQQTLILAMPAERFFRLIRESRDFSQYLANGMADCISATSELLRQVSFSRLDQRLADLILRMSDLSGSARVRLTHQGIANEVGATREVVSRLLKDLENAGHIRLGRGSIEITARDRLRELSELC